MKKILMTFVLLLSSLSIFAEQRQSLSEEVQAEVLAVFEANENLFESFFDYDGEEVEKNAALVKSKIDEISKDSVKELLRFSQQQLAQMKADNDRSENDEKYHLVSMALIHLVNTFDLGEGYNAYSCPMVKKKWVQNSSKRERVHNPYDPKMKHCGTKDTNF